MIVTTLQPIALPPLAGTHKPGTLHVSRIIGDMMKRLKPKQYDKHDAQGKPVPMDAQKVTYGQNFEQALERMLVQTTFPALFRPEPIILDGIWMSPDGVIDGTQFGLDMWVVAEYKLTWYSERKPCPESVEFLPWLWQMQAYCKGLGTRFGLLVPQFINGTYYPPTPSQPIPRLLEWTQQEIDDNWAMLRNHAIAQGWL